MSSQQQSTPQKAFWFLICLAILGFGIGGFSLLKALKPAPQQREQAVAIPLVETLSLNRRQSPLLVEGNGIVRPRAVISLSSQVSGEVVSLHPQLITGGSFRQGETIIQIDPRSFAANLAEAQASQRVNQANLAYLDKQIERIRSLREGGFAPEENLDDLISRHEQTLANIARQEAIIENRSLDLERSSIKAAFDGKVLSESVDLGDIVAPGRELARFYASDAVEVVVALQASDASFIPHLWDSKAQNKRRAWVTVEYGGARYQWVGYVDRVEADIDSTTRTVDVVVTIPHPFTPGVPVDDAGHGIQLEAPPLLVGMYTRVDIEGMRLPGHFVIPVSALHENNTIWTVQSENRLKIVPVEFVRQENDQAVLLAPQLPAGTPIIISDIALVSDGMQVQIQGAGQ